MENAENVAVIPVDIGWVTWETVQLVRHAFARRKRQRGRGSPRNHRHAQYAAVREKRLIAAIGVKTSWSWTPPTPSCLPLDREQEVRDMVKLLGKQDCGMALTTLYCDNAATTFPKPQSSLTQSLTSC